MISKTKIDESFLISQFLFNDIFLLYSFCRNANGGAIWVILEININTGLVKTNNIETNKKVTFIKIGLKY